MFTIPLLATFSVNPEFALFAVLLSGFLLGRVTIKGFQLGSAGIIFTGLLAGHWGLTIPDGVGVLGMILFVYCLGVNAGPGFFTTLSQNGVALLFLGASMICSAAGTAWLLTRLVALPADLATGLFAGALTSTPALATATELLPPDSELTVGFGIAYPLGTLLVILFVQAAPRLKLNHESGDAGKPLSPNSEKQISRYYIEVLNPALEGKRLSEIPLLDDADCQVSRVLIEDQFRPISSQFRLSVGQHLFVVGSDEEIRSIIDLFGRISPYREDASIEADQQHRRRVVVSSREVIGKSLKQLHLRSRFGITISRIRRHDVEFVPDAQVRLHLGDAVTAIGEPEDLDRFMQYAGHRVRAFDETDLFSLSFGIAVGLLLGAIEFRLGDEGFSLGKAGGPLIAGLLLGYFGRIGSVMGHFPAAARLLLTELGLALFLADAGVRAGGTFVDVLTTHGPVLVLSGMAITLVPLIVGFAVGHSVLKLPLQPLLGGICGAMTSTPGLGALMSSEDANEAVRSYASIYPLALMLMSLIAPLLLSVLSAS
ncbi:aspartate:alanine exchanger family transporter [Rubinisphaera brasiliensis]|uniref:YidE/YbjL duplication n=1 Tax=Rubinisphaera brasiliensis (strain ATCC 49424 / DSM 5305 / JCM 21570 / IAM 15109 / NBRC 103401 / IFAM 1448) TaxID=756272 RepID=F0SMI9_RUBBR|nr:TrkA C-terminal domain-containing protein [Rubinisphaera brasiliensis]ADY57751.1 YidE/YbjL duplication [Rubinisphaera brasiliensis DSM 5305]